MARSKFRTRLGRTHHHALRTRRAVHHHGFLTRFHRPVTGGKMPHKHRGGTRQHVLVKKSAHAGHVIAKKSRAKAAAHPGRVKVRNYTRAKAARHPTGTGHRPMSTSARANLSRALKGKPHPHRGHAMSTAARAKISAKTTARLTGKPHPHKGHAISNVARAKISKSLAGKPHTRRTTRKKK